MGDKQGENWGQKPGAKWNRCFAGAARTPKCNTRLYRYLRRLLYLSASTAVVKALTSKSLNNPGQSLSLPIHSSSHVVSEEFLCKILGNFY